LEPGEDLAACAQRELSEETGRRASSLELLVSVFTSPGFCDERIHIYLARLDPEAVGEQHPDEDERLRVETLPLAQALEMALAGRIRDAKSVVGLTLAAARVGALGRVGEDGPR
jgi:ADP-ribose pyrophosphatase